MPVIAEIPAPVIDTVWSGAELVRVITLPVSAIESPVPAVSVTPVEPDVLELIIEVVEVPAPTVRLPSLVANWSGSVLFTVKTPDADVTVTPPVPATTDWTGATEITGRSRLPAPSVMRMFPATMPKAVFAPPAAGVAGFHVFNVPSHVITWPVVACVEVEGMPRLSCAVAEKTSPQKASIKSSCFILT